jgi:hypothetical protein
LTLFRNIIKLNDWDGGLQSVQDAERAHENQKIRSNLQMLTETAKNKVLRQEMELFGISIGSGSGLTTDRERKHTLFTGTMRG